MLKSKEEIFVEEEGEKGSGMDGLAIKQTKTLRQNSELVTELKSWFVHIFDLALEQLIFQLWYPLIINTPKFVIDAWSFLGALAFRSTACCASPIFLVPCSVSFSWSSSWGFLLCFFGVLFEQSISYVGSSCIAIVINVSFVWFLVILYNLTKWAQVVRFTIGVLLIYSLLTKQKAPWVCSFSHSRFCSKLQTYHALPSLMVRSARSYYYYSCRLLNGYNLSGILLNYYIYRWALMPGVWVVITLVSHTRGPTFKPGFRHFSKIYF